VEFELKYNKAQEEFRDEVRTWLAANVPDGITARPRTFEESYAVYLKRRELGRKLGAKGWLYPSGEKQYGGGGLDLDRIIVLEAETARLGLGLPPYYDSGGKMGSASIRVWGTDEQKQRFLPPIYRGEVRSWQLLTEPSAGSDLAGVKSTAIRDGDVYVVNGQKIYIGSHHAADRYWTILVTDPKGKRHQNVSWFMIDASLPGITTQPLHMLSAQSEGETDEFGHKNIIFFDNVRVPADCLVGGENNGWKVASTHLEVEHSGQGNIRTNPVWLALLAHCRTQQRDGRPLIEAQTAWPRICSVLPGRRRWRTGPAPENCTAPAAPISSSTRPAPRVPSKQVNAKTLPATNLRASSAVIWPAKAGTITAPAVTAPKTKRASML